MSLLYHVNNSFQGRIVDGFGHSNKYASRPIDRSGKHLIADLLMNKFTFACQRGFVHPCLSFRDNTVHRKTLSGPDPDHVIDLKRLNRDSLVFSVPT